MSKVLIIEDNVDIATLIKDSLFAQGFETVVCHDGLQGLQFAMNSKPDVILLDLMIPAGGGISLLEKIRMSALTNAIPVVVLTASKDPDQKQRVLQLGIKAFLEKPYDSKELVATIRGIIEKK